MSNPWKDLNIIKISPEGAEEVADKVILEQPLTVFFNDRELVTMLGTPMDLEELAVGFLAAEGFLDNREELQRVEADPAGGVVRVYSKKNRPITEQAFQRRYITSGCGRGSSFYHVQDAMGIKPLDDDTKIASEMLSTLAREAQHRSELFLATGGVHSAGLAGPEGIIVFREDIGRHNAVDKVFGRAFLDGIGLSGKILFTTGRVSSEIILKTARAGVPLLVSRSAPTELAVRMAGEVGITLVGFARGRRFNIYSHPQRIILQKGPEA